MEADLGHVLIGTTSGSALELENAYVAHDTVTAEERVHKDIPLVPVAFPLRNVTSLQRGGLNVTATVLSAAFLAATITTFDLVARNGFRHP